MKKCLTYIREPVLRTCRRRLNILNVREGGSKQVLKWSGADDVRSGRT
jgi:hypothetical protein